MAPAVSCPAAGRAAGENPPLHPARYAATFQLRELAPPLASGMDFAAHALHLQRQIWANQVRCALSFSARSVFSQENPPSASGARPK